MLTSGEQMCARTHIFEKLRKTKEKQLIGGGGNGISKKMINFAYIKMKKKLS